MNTASKILEVAAMGVVQSGIRKTSKLVQIESTKKYLEALQAIRHGWMSILTTQFFMFLSAVALVVFVISGVFLLPLSIEIKLMTICVFSFVILFGSILCFQKLNSEKNWLEISKADLLLKKALNIRS